MTIKTLWQQAGVYNAVDDRRLIGMMLAQGSDPLSGIGRVYAGLVVQAKGTPDWSVNVTAGRCVIPTPASDGGGFYLFNDATANVVVTPVGSQPRIDLVVAEVVDPDYAGGLSQGQFRIVQGTPAGSPTAPAQPSGTLLLATLTHAGSASSVATAAISNAQVDERLVGYSINTTASGGLGVNTFSAAAGPMAVKAGHSYLITVEAVLSTSVANAWIAQYLYLGINTAVVWGTNLVRQCQHIHVGADYNFPSIINRRYKPASDGSLHVGWGVNVPFGPATSIKLNASTSQPLTVSVVDEGLTSFAL